MKLIEGYRRVSKDVGWIISGGGRLIKPAVYNLAFMLYYLISEELFGIIPRSLQFAIMARIQWLLSLKIAT